MIPFLPPGARFPPVERARRRPDGLLAAGADLTVDTLVRAYTHGIFPWFNEGDPILWWSPNPRMVLPCANFHLSRSLRRRLKRHDVCVSFDRAFAEMLAACAAPRDDEGGTWLVPDMQAAYLEMHERGLAHSVEVWRGERLLGGLYGVALGKMFFGESMVSMRDRRVEDRAGLAGGADARVGHADHRLPDGDAAPRIARRARGAAAAVHRMG